MAERGLPFSAAEIERREEQARREAALFCPDLHEGPPVTVCGLDLDGLESALFHDARAAGVFVRPSWFPVFSSDLPEAWRRWCEREGIPHPSEPAS